MTIVRWRYEDERDRPPRIESFETKAQAKRWVAHVLRSNKRHPEEAQVVIVDAHPPLRDPRRGSRRPARMRPRSQRDAYDRLSRAGKNYIEEYLRGTTREDVIAAWHRVPERERRIVDELLEGERPYYEHIESEIAHLYED
jgi:hypothetical protein